jgi:hypothetical protein
MRIQGRLNQRERAFKRATGLFLTVLLLISAGCAGYQLGPTNGVPAGSRSVKINLFRNETWEPRLSEPLATALRRSIQRDGTYRLATREEGDLLVNGVITDFTRSGITFQPSDSLTVRDYELSAQARFTAIERGTGRVVVESTVFGRTTIRSGPDLASAERQASALIAEDLARNITALLVDGSW